MYNYSGIKPEIIELLSVNRFNDSKAFYEEHKEELKQGATVPMRQWYLIYPMSFVSLIRLWIQIQHILFPVSDVIQGAQRANFCIGKIFG